MATLFAYTGTVALGLKAINGLCFKHNYQDFLDYEETIPNPESKKHFAIRMLKEYVRDAIVLLAEQDAKDIAQPDIQAAIDAAIIEAEGVDVVA